MVDVRWYAYTPYIPSDRFEFTLVYVLGKSLCYGSDITKYNKKPFVYNYRRAIIFGRLQRLRPTMKLILTEKQKT